MASYLESVKNDSTAGEPETGAGGNRVESPKLLLNSDSSVVSLFRFFLESNPLGELLLIWESDSINSLK